MMFLTVNFINYFVGEEGSVNLLKMTAWEAGNFHNVDMTMLSRIWKR